jgi:hypothetical protein
VSFLDADVEFDFDFDVEFDFDFDVEFDTACITFARRSDSSRRTQLLALMPPRPHKHRYSSHALAGERDELGEQDEQGKDMRSGNRRESSIAAAAREK